jgi:hypothetical protein
MAPPFFPKKIFLYFLGGKSGGNFVYFGGIFVIFWGGFLYFLGAFLIFLCTNITKVEYHKS